MPEPLQPAPPRQLIRNAAWVVAWDEAAQSHVYRRDVDLKVEGDTVAAIGPADYADAVEIDEADPEGRRAATEVALCELMQSGVTTVCDLSAARGFARKWPILSQSTSF
jgi:hypothetical protein